MTNHATLQPPDRKSSCILPWVLLAILVVGLAGTAWWGYTRRAEVARYAVSSLLDQQLKAMLPPGVDPATTVMRVAAVLNAVQLGNFDAEQLRGMGALFRSYYDDKQLNREELESLLAFAEIAVVQ